MKTLAKDIAPHLHYAKKGEQFQTQKPHSYMHKRRHPRPNNFISPWRLPLLFLLLFCEYQMPRDILHLHQLLHFQYLSSDLRQMGEINDLETSMKSERF